MLLLLVLRGLHVEHWTKNMSTSDGVVNLTIFVTTLDLLFAILLLKVVIMLLVVLLVVQLVLVVLSLQKCILLLLVCWVTKEILSTYILSRLRRSLLFFLRLLLLLSLLLLLCSSIYSSLQSVDPAGERISLFLVDLELEYLFVLLRHP